MQKFSKIGPSLSRTTTSSSFLRLCRDLAGLNIRVIKSQAIFWQMYNQVGNFVCEQKMFVYDLSVLYQVCHGVASFRNDEKG